MFKIVRILKGEEIEEYTCKDGSLGRSKKVFIEPEGSIYPVKIAIADADYKVGKKGERVSLDVRVYPFMFKKQADGSNQRQKAMMNIYVPLKK